VPDQDEEHIEQLVGALRWQGIQPELAVIGLTAPGMAVLGAIVDEDQKAHCRQALDRSVQQSLRLAINPMQVLKDQDDGLLARFSQQQLPKRVKGAVAALYRIECLPRGIVHGHIKQGQHRRTRFRDSSSVSSLPDTFSLMSRSSSCCWTLK
jgi:hypothetical protein